MLNIGARTKVNKTFKQTNRIKRTKREKRDKRGETWRASIDRRSSATLRPSVTFYESFPLSQWIIFSPRIVDHVRSKCSSKRMSGIIYTSGRNASGINKRNKGKRREWLVAEMPLFISLWRRGQIPVILSSFYSLFSRNIPPQEYI